MLKEVANFFLMGDPEYSILLRVRWWVVAVTAS